jgi:hypothetical protein
MEEIALFLGTRERDIHKPPFLFQFSGREIRTRMREHPLFQSDEEDDREFESLRTVYRHELYRIRPCLYLIRIRSERDFFEEHAECLFGRPSIVFLRDGEKFLGIFLTSRSLRRPIIERS